MHVLVSSRLTLRKPTWLDAEEIAAGLADWNVARMLAPVPFPYHVEDAEDWIAAMAADPQSLVYTIHRERLIGVVGLHGGGSEPSLGYWLAEPWHGHGFMTEAAGLLIAHAAATRSVSGIVSSVFADNPASLRVQEKLGFRLTGTGQTFSRSRGAAVQTLTTRLSLDEARLSEGNEMVAA